MSNEIKIFGCPSCGKPLNNGKPDSVKFLGRVLPCTLIADSGDTVWEDAYITLRRVRFWKKSGVVPFEVEVRLGAGCLFAKGFTRKRVEAHVVAALEAGEALRRFGAIGGGLGKSKSPKARPARRGARKS